MTIDTKHCACCGKKLKDNDKWYDNFQWFCGNCFWEGHNEG